MKHLTVVVGCAVLAFVAVAFGRWCAAEGSEAPLLRARDLRAAEARVFVNGVRELAKENAQLWVEVESRLAKGDLSAPQTAGVLWALAHPRTDAVASWCLDHITLTAVPVSSVNLLLERPAWWLLAQRGAGVLDPLRTWLADAERDEAALRAVAELLDHVFGPERAKPVASAALSGVPGSVLQRNLDLVRSALDRLYRR